MHSNRAEGSEINQEKRSKFNSMTAVFVIVSVLAATVFFSGLISIIFPESGIPFLWVVFPVGPQAAPI